MQIYYLKNNKKLKTSVSNSDMKVFSTHHHARHVVKIKAKKDLTLLKADHKIAFFVNHKDKYGEKPIAIAFYANCFKAIDILLEAGTIIDKKDLMIIKNRIRHCGLKTSIRVKLLKRLYEIVSKPFV